jgi:hypothetical protein
MVLAERLEHNNFYLRGSALVKSAFANLMQNSGRPMGALLMIARAVGLRCKRIKVVTAMPV